jgi:hypothetical protein
MLTLLPLLISTFFVWVFLSEVRMNSVASYLAALLFIGLPAVLSAYLWKKAAST